jgi:hypothetical protein
MFSYGCRWLSFYDIKLRAELKNMKMLKIKFIYEYIILQIYKILLNIDKVNNTA